MAAIRDLADELGHLVRDPAEDEEGRVDPIFVQEVEGTLGRLLQPALEAVPLAALNQAVEGADVEVIFQRDREDVGAGIPGRVRPNLALRASDRQRRRRRPVTSAARRV
jgi:hypothetical protein